MDEKLKEGQCRRWKSTGKTFWVVSITGGSARVRPHCPGDDHVNLVSNIEANSTPLRDGESIADTNPTGRLAAALQADDEERPPLPRGGLTRAVDDAERRRQQQARAFDMQAGEEAAERMADKRRAAALSDIEERGRAIGVDLGKPMPRHVPGRRCEVCGGESPRVPICGECESGERSYEAGFTAGAASRDEEVKVLADKMREAVAASVDRLVSKVGAMPLGAPSLPDCTACGKPAEFISGAAGCTVLCTSCIVGAPDDIPRARLDGSEPNTAWFSMLAREAAEKASPADWRGHRDRMIRLSAEASGRAHADACGLVAAYLERAPICCPGDMRAPALSVSEGALWAEVADAAADRRWAEICAAAGVERRPEPPTPSSSQAPRFPPSFSRGPRRRP